MSVCTPCGKGDILFQVLDMMLDMNVYMLWCKMYSLLGAKLEKLENYFFL